MSASDTTIQEDGFGVIPRIVFNDANNVQKTRKSFEYVKRFTLTNKNKSSVQLISWGASIQSIRVPDKKRNFNDVVLGYDSLDGYLSNRYMGSIIGRVVNRVADGFLFIDGKRYNLTKNDETSQHQINGGFHAFDNVNWDACVVGKQVVMSHLSKSGSEGYPGDMLTQVHYSWTDEDQLHINIRAVATEPTPANITNYCLFNLAGHGTGPKELYRHVATVNADKWTFMDVRNNLPTGAICPVDRTVYDLRSPTQLSREQLYKVPGGGYNHNLCINTPTCLVFRFHARMIHPNTGRYMEVYSNHPGLQLYTANDLNIGDRGYNAIVNCAGDKDFSSLREKSKVHDWRYKDGLTYKRHSGFALTPQNYPDAVNIETFPSCILHPGKVYTHDITYKFGIIK